MSSDPRDVRSDILDALPADGPPIPPIPYPPRGVCFFRLHPNFWWALLWCFGMMFITQMLGGVVAVVIIVIAMFADPDMARGNQNLDPADILRLPVGQIAIGLAQWLAHFLIIVFALAALRLVAGRHWAREVAVRRPALFHVVLVVALTPAFILLANGAYYVAEKKLGIPSASNVGATLAFLGAIGLTLLLIGLVHLFVGLAAGFDWTKRVWSNSPPLGSIAFSMVLLSVFLGLTALFYGTMKPLFERFIPPDPNAQSLMHEVIQQIVNWPLPLAVFIIAVMPAFSEELWCRAFLGRGLVGKHGYLWGVLTASFLFGFIHLDPVQGTMACVLGIVLHYVYLTSQSLWLPMLLHFLNNSMAVVLSRLSGPVADVEKDAGSLPWWLFAAAGFLLVSGCWALYETRARLVAPEGVEPWKPPHPGVACPPPDSLTLVHSPAPSLATIAAMLVSLGAFVAAFVATLGM